MAPHPDDEIIGMGGFLLQMMENKCRIHIIYLTDGEGSGSFPDKEIIRQERINLSKNALNELHIPNEHVYRLHLQDSAIPRKGHNGFSEASEIITEIIEKTKPEAVFATHFIEYWPFDHIACFELAQDAISKANHKTSLWLYWVWTWFHLRPWQIFKILKVRTINIAPQHHRKMEMMNQYLSPKSPTNIPWSGNLPKAMLYPFSVPIEIIENYETTSIQSDQKAFH